MSDSALTAIEFLVVGHFELKRYEGWKKYKTVRDPFLVLQRRSLPACWDAKVVSECWRTCADSAVSRAEAHYASAARLTAPHWPSLSHAKYMCRCSCSKLLARSRVCWTASPSTRWDRTAPSSS